MQMICEPTATYSLRHKESRLQLGARQMLVLPLGQQSHNTFSRPSRILSP